MKITFLAAPFIAISASYFIFDPFQVIYPKEDYYLQNRRVEPNRDWVSTQKFLLYKDTEKYDSFIFGSSRSLAYKCEDWKELIPEIKPFHYDAAKESLYGIWAKIKYLDKINQPIQNAILAVDADLLKNTKNVKTHLFIKHPEISGESRIKFHLVFFTAYFQKLFFAKYLDCRWSGKYKPWMGSVIQSTIIKFTAAMNDRQWKPNEDWLVDPKKFHEEHFSTSFYSRKGINRYNAPIVLGEEQKQMLYDIKHILDKKGSDYQVIINPMYDQIFINKQDLAFMQHLFGVDRVHDFSGSAEFTDDPLNFYNASHFKPAIGKEILRRIYAG